MEKEERTVLLRFCAHASTLLSCGEKGALSYPAGYGLYGLMAHLWTGALFSRAERGAVPAGLSMTVAHALHRFDREIPMELLYTAMAVRGYQRAGTPETEAFLADAAAACANGAKPIYGTRALAENGREAHLHDGRLGFLLPLLTESSGLTHERLSRAAEMLLQDAEAPTGKTLFSYAAKILFSACCLSPHDPTVTEALWKIASVTMADGTPFFAAEEAAHALLLHLAPLFRSAAADGPCDPGAYDMRTPLGGFRFAFSAGIAALAAAWREAPPDIPANFFFDEEGTEAILAGRRRALSFCAKGACLSVGIPESRLSLTASPEALLFGGEAHILQTAGKLSPMKGGFLAYGSASLLDLAGESFGGTEVGRFFYAAAALPDDETVLILSAFRAERGFYAARLSPLSFTVCDRDPDASYYYAGERHARARLRKKNADRTEIGRHCHMSDKLGVVATQEIQLFLGEDGRDRLTVGDGMEERHYSAGESVAYGAALAVGSVRRTYALDSGFLTLDGLPTGVKSLSAVAANRKRYTLLYNLSDTSFDWEGYTLPAGEAVLLAWDHGMPKKKRQEEP